MSTSALVPTALPTDEVDADIAMSGTALAEARRSYARCPSAENARLLAAVLAAVDRLLDLRLALRG